ncbi:6-phosphogluconolactonase [Reinekea sp.]|jgi:6-phosphogluconolactonase|uniref:6-phosphogluconolactonase n=1 Tax=Reinekea sp. TaxID=1970455 RepID=UPI002A8070B1|nr:6-phosphogluconolactonase [Reinekea sp.]
MITPQVFSDRDSLTCELSEQIVERLNADLLEFGTASLAVSGGRTPVDLLQRLSRAELDWSRIWVTLVDERWVDVTDEASNERLVRDNLLIHHAAQARFIGLKTEHDRPEEAVASLADALSVLPDRFSVVVLGMGEDGHTASFFPGAATLAACLDLSNPKPCCATLPLTAPHARMTLTLKRILASRWLVLHLTGVTKLPVLADAWQDGPIEQMPVRSVMKQDQSPLAIYFAS